MTQVLCISYHGELQFEVQPLVDILPPPYFVEPVPDVGAAGPSSDRGDLGGVSLRRDSPIAGIADSIGARVRRRRLASQKPIAVSSSGVIYLSDEEADVGASERSPAVRDMKLKGRVDRGSSAIPCSVSQQVSEEGPSEGVLLFAEATRGLDAIQAQLGIHRRVVAERDALRSRLNELESGDAAVHRLGGMPEFVTLVERLCAASFAVGEAIGRRDGPEESVEFGPFDDPRTVMDLLLDFKRV